MDRHSYAVNALRAGMPERVLKIVGGWKKIPDTYFHTLDAEDAMQSHRGESKGPAWGERHRVEERASNKAKDNPVEGW